MDDELAKKRESYTRVSSILYPFSGLADVPQDLVEHAAERGTKVHTICEGIVTGLGEFGVDDETRPYVESFKQWWEMGHDVIMHETRFWDDGLEVTGQVDYVVRTPTGLEVVDIKTSFKPSKTWQVQAEAYMYLLLMNGHKWIKGATFLHLQKDGSIAKTKYFPFDVDLWLNTYETWRHFYYKPPRKNDKRSDN